MSDADIPTPDDAPADADVPADAPDTAATPDDPPEVAPEEDNPVLARALKDAARYRSRLRETEGERDALRTTIEGYHRVEAERIAADHLADGADLWRDGAEITELLGDDGRIDAGKVADAARTMVEAHPHWRKAPPRRPSQGLSSGNNFGAKPGADWATVLKGAG